jgi:hypothetical protein
MHAIRSLVILLVAATVSFAQAPKDDRQIVITARLLTIHESERANYEKFGKLIHTSSLTGSDKPGQPGLPEVLKALEEYRTVTVSTLPKVTLFDGQTAEITSGKPEKVTTGLGKDGPIQEWIHNGTQMKLKATLDKTGKPVSINVDAKHTVINHNVPPAPIKTTTASSGPLPISYAKPDIEIAKHGGIFGYENGGSHIWDMGTLNIRTERALSPIVLGRVPYVNRLFHTKKWTSEKYQMYLILTADIIEQSPVVEK